MDNLERLNLQKMIAANDTKDCTEEIREKCHSSLIRDDVDKLLSLKKQYSRLASSNPQEFDTLCVSRCSFLFNHYTDIFNKIKKNELDVNILFTFINTLKDIETGTLDQHEASVKIGKILKSLYIDSALKKADKIDKFNEKKSKQKKKVDKNISWNQYKKAYLNK